MAVTAGSEQKVDPLWKAIRAEAWSGSEREQPFREFLAATILTARIVARSGEGSRALEMDQQFPHDQQEGSGI